MTAAVDPTGNCARFAARPLTVGGTPAPVWLDALAGARELDLTDCDEIVVVAAHPDDETLGCGAWRRPGIRAHGGDECGGGRDNED